MLHGIINFLKKLNDCRPKQNIAQLRLVGDKRLPDIIPLTLGERPFYIGRYDISKGYKQCDYEFGQDTRAVSRRHAAFERFSYGYAVVDLNSRAGTFVNGTRINPGEQFRIKQGDRISFGNAGADYIFKVEEGRQ